MPTAYAAYAAGVSPKLLVTAIILEPISPSNYSRL